MEEVCVHAVSTEEGKSAAKFQETLHQQIHTPIETQRWFDDTGPRLWACCQPVASQTRSASHAWNQLSNSLPLWLL